MKHTDRRYHIMRQAADGMSKPVRTVASLAFCRDLLRDLNEMSISHCSDSTYHAIDTQTGRTIR